MEYKDIKNAPGLYHAKPYHYGVKADWYRLGLVHYIPIGEKTIFFDKDVHYMTRKKIIKKFEQLELEIMELIDKNTEVFNDFLEKNGLKSSMGSIGKK